ncbi:hypothetical protein NL676_022743 [Syzygium grande]|nr:hypothetical protein NL676_022743 [Syzygium grande]
MLSLLKPTNATLTATITTTSLILYSFMNVSLGAAPVPPPQRPVLMPPSSSMGLLASPSSSPSLWLLELRSCSLASFGPP